MTDAAHTRWTAALGLLLLLASLAVALVARRATAPGHLLDAPLADGTTFLVDDPDGAYHLRRVQLALANGEVPLFDRFLNHPEGSAVPWPSLFAGALTVAVQAALPRDPAAHRSTGGYSEAEVEHFLAGLPPWIGMGAAAAVALALLGLTRRVRGAPRLWPAALAAWCFAAVPIAVWYGAAGRIDHHVAVQLCFALELALVGVCLRTDESLDALAFALLGGLVAGVLLLLWLASALIVGLVGAALFAAAASAHGELGAARRRAGLLFFAAAAAVVLVPAEASPWNDVQPGSLVNLSLGVPRALLGACLPFVALEVAARLGWKRVPGVLLALVVAAAAVALLPGFLGGVREGLAWAARENEFMDVVAESRPLLGRVGPPDFAAAVSDLGLLGLVFPLLWLGLAVSELWRRRWWPERWLLLATAALWFVQTLGQRRFGDALAVPMCLVAALAVHDLAAARMRWGRWLGGALAALLVLASLPSLGAVWTVPEAEQRALVRWRAELVEGLRWMRTGTPSPGPWNAPSARQDYGVLAPWGLGHWIEYHARRPSIATNFGSFVGERGFRGAAAALVADDAADLERRLVELDADYVVVRARDVSDLASHARLAGWDGAARAELFERAESSAQRGRGKAFSARAQTTALWRLGVHDLPVGSRAPGFGGLELVHRSDGVEGLGGAPPGPGVPSGPRLSIWRRSSSAEPERVPSLAPPPR